MHIQKNQKSKKYILIGIGALVILLLGYTAAAWSYSFWPFNSAQKTNLRPPSSDEKQAGDQIKADSLRDAATDTPKGEGNQTLTPQPQSDSSKSTVSVEITATDQNNPYLQIRVLIQSLMNNGECKITLAKGTSTYTTSVPTAPTASTSTCQGFDVPISKLSPGTWKAVVDVSNGTTAGQAIKEGIEIQ